MSTIQGKMYATVDEMWGDCITYLLEDCNRRCRDGEAQPSRDGDVCGEIVGYKAQLHARDQATFVTNAVRRMVPSASCAETLWYMSGRDDVATMRRYVPSYGEFVGSDHTAYGAYGPRVMGMTPWIGNAVMGRSPLEFAVDCVKRAGHSRQAVVPIWRPADCYAASRGQADIPCTVSWQFILRDRALNMIVTMRSNDAWLGFPNDVFAFTCFQRVVAAELDVDVGTYHHQVGSMHLYARDETKAREAVLGPTATRVHGWPYIDDTLTTCRAAVEVEHELRTRGTFRQSQFDSLGCMCRDLVSACAAKLGLPGYWEPSSVLLRKRKARDHEAVDREHGVGDGDDGGE